MNGNGYSNGHNGASGNTDKIVLGVIRKVLKKHRLGELVYLTITGANPWGVSQKTADYSYQAIYASREEHSYQTYISGLPAIRLRKNITLQSLERCVAPLIKFDAGWLVAINSPAIFATKEFLELRNFFNKNLCKKIYEGCQRKIHRYGRQGYLDEWQWLTCGIVALEKGRVIADLTQANKRYLKIPAINKIIEAERSGSVFDNQKVCDKVTAKLKGRLDLVLRRTKLPDAINLDKFRELKILRKINYQYWLNEYGYTRYTKTGDFTTLRGGGR
ncbi:MAG: hypothetical protein HY401_09125 [Elusimicrobia bacterium]|nr:hypothetical protein [Elusimicrobiota bacterium]